MKWDSECEHSSMALPWMFSCSDESKELSQFSTRRVPAADSLLLSLKFSIFWK